MKSKIKVLIIIFFIAFAICLIVLLSNKEEKYNNKRFNYLETADEEKNITIKQKYECNEFNFITVTTEDLITSYFNKYKTYAINNIEQAYNLLDEEYREKKFGSLENYKTYVANNSDKIKQSTLKSYKVQKNTDTTRYVCIDQNEKYYIFDETAIMEYTIILDAYTIDLPEFIDKYTSATDQQKVALNIEKFMQAITDDDYKYAYSCLADSYKDNYFKTQEEFENYAKENFYSNSTVGYNQFRQEGEVYTYSVVLTNKETGEQMNKTFIVKLEEGTDFVLSFNK